MHLPLPVWAMVLAGTVNGKGAIHLPLYRRETPSFVRRATAEIGLGDYADVTYSVVLTVGSVSTSLVLDTGSSDLWVIADNCVSCPTTNLPLYPHSTFKSTGLAARLFYGDSQTGTHAFGEIGADSVGLAGLSTPTQYFAAITDTNTSVMRTGDTGIFGLGFPINSFIWSQTFKAANSKPTSARREAEPEPEPHRPQFPNPKSLYDRRGGSNYKRPQFPDISSLYPTSPSSTTSKRQSTVDPGEWTDYILSTWLKTGPFLSRLVQTSDLDAPMYAVTLQRLSFEIGGNAGLLSIGSLPEGVSNDSLTWVPLRPYRAADGGLSPPASSPTEEYPLTWEIFVDDVYLDGQKLPRSSLPSPTIQLSALVDTGNSLLRGPRDVVNEIYQRLGSDRNGVFPCAKAHTIAFSIGGKLFPVDPRDFISQAYKDDTTRCTANLVNTDIPIPGQGYLFQWSLGDPFLKSVLSAYHFGNITHPSRDQPKMGFLSTVPANADELFSKVVEDVQKQGGGSGNFPWTSVSAPSGSLPQGTAVVTNSDGVQQAATTTAAGKPGSTGLGGSSNDGGDDSSAWQLTIERWWLAGFGAWVMLNL